jgi:ketosteroid isomerase-like protein
VSFISLCARQVADSQRGSYGQAMDDDQAIHRLITVYSQLLDDCRWDEWAELFTEDAVFSVWGKVYQGRAEIHQGISGMQPALPGKHVAFATICDVSGDEALAWTDFVALADDGAGEWGRSYKVATVARYYDRLTRYGDRWRFSHRAIRMAGDPLPDGATPTPTS